MLYYQFMNNEQKENFILNVLLIFSARSIPIIQCETQNIKLVQC